MSSCVAKGGTMAKTISASMDELRKDLAYWKSELEHLRTMSSDLAAIERIERWVAEAERVLSRWDKAG